MKRLVLVLTLSLSGYAYADQPKCSAQGKCQQNPNWMKDQHDQTDTYAIPLDTSEEEEAIEEKELQNLAPTKKKPMTSPQTTPKNP